MLWGPPADDLSPMPPLLLPEEIRAFLEHCVTSVEELALLLMLMASAGRWWDAAAAGQTLGLPERRARRMLDSLTTRNLLDIRISDDVHYQFRPGSADLQHGAAALDAFYRDHPGVVLRWAAGLGGASITEFADAFLWRWR
jgi:hypothetical protein